MNDKKEDAKNLEDTVINPSITSKKANTIGSAIKFIEKINSSPIEDLIKKNCRLLKQVIQPVMITQVVEAQKNITAFFELISITKSKLHRVLKPIIEIERREHKLNKFIIKLNASEKLGENQFVFWNLMNQELASKIVEAEDINVTMFNYYSKDNFTFVKQTIQKCKTNKFMKNHKKLFSQSISAYNKKHYHSAIIVLLVVFDSLLSDVSYLYTTSIYKRAEFIINKIEQNTPLEKDEYAFWLLYSTFTKMAESVSTNQYPFSGQEPDNLNRHWIMHGRTEKQISQLDCIKIINLIYGTLLFAELSDFEVIVNNV